MESRDYWQLRAHKSGEQLAREEGGDSGTWRAKIRDAKDVYGDLHWFTPVPKMRVGIAVFDLHHPHHVKKLWKNILRFTEDIKPDIWVFGGDNEDLEVVSHWVGNKRRRVEGKRLKKDYDDFNRDILDPLEAILPAEAERVFMLGNHEDWVEQYIDEHPEMEGFAEIRNNLHVDNWQVFDYGNVYTNGKLNFMHGTYINIHNAYKTVQVYGKNIVYGHGHTFQAHTMTTPIGVESHMAMQVPCACDMNPHYALNRPNAWLNGFAVFYLQPDGSFNLFPVIATDSAFIAPNGKLYK